MSERLTTNVSEPVIVEMDEFKIIGTSCSTTMDVRHEKIPMMVKEFYKSHVQKIHNRINKPVSYGFFIDPPNWDPETEEFTWIACVEVSDFDNIPKEMISKVIPARKYATLRYDPTTDDFDPYPYLHRWLKDEGFEQIDNYGFEKYNPNKGTSSEFILHLPIK